jgi:hypothetical protein
MAGPSDFRKHMDSLYEGAASIFEQGQKPSSHFLSISATDPLKEYTETLDRVGREKLRGVFAGRATILGADVSSPLKGYSGKITESALSQGFLPAAAVNQASAPKNILFAWDKPLTQEFLGRLAPSKAGETVAPIVPIRQVFAKFFGDVPFEGQRTLEGAFAGLQKAGVIPGNLGDLNKAQKLEAIYGAALQRTSGDKMALGWFKQFLADAGVPGISGSTRSFWSGTDPLGINRLAPGIKNTTKGSLYFSGGLGSRADFLGGVRKFYGAGYEELLRDFMGDMFARTGGRDKSSLAFTMTQHGGIYMGRHGIGESFVPLMAERIGEARLPRAGDKGLPFGFQTFGDKLRASRQMDLGRGGGPITQTERAFELIGETLELSDRSSLKLGPGQVIAAVRQAGTAQGELGDLARPIISRGRTSLHAGFYDIGSTYRKGGAFPNYARAIEAMNIAVSRSNLQPDYWDKVIMPNLTKDLVELEKAGLIDSAATVKGSLMLGKEGEFGVVPSKLAREFFLPGQTMTVKALGKGLYAKRGVQEIREVSRIRHLASSRRLLGMEPLPYSIGTTTGDVATRIGIGQIMDSQAAGMMGYTGVGRSAKGQFLKAADRILPVTGFPLVATAIGGKASGALGLANLFGDAGALMHAKGKRTTDRLFSGAMGIRELPGHEVRAERAHLESWIKGIAAPGQENKVKRALAALEPGGTRSGRFLFKEDDPLRIRKGFKGVPIPGGKMWGAPEFAESITGFDIPSQQMYGRAPVTVYSQTGEQGLGHISLLVNDQRVTARGVGKASEDIAARALGLSTGAYQRLAGTADVIMSAADLQKNLAATEFTHRTGLLGFKPTGGPGASMTLEQRAARFLELMGTQTAAGGIDQTIVAGAGYTPEGFAKASMEAGKKLGYTTGQIRGQQWGRAGTEQQRIMGGMQFLQESNMGVQGGWIGLKPLYGETKGSGLHNIVTSASMRFGETEEIAKGTFKLRLNALQTQFSTVNQYIGIQPQQHPVLRLMAQELAGDHGFVNPEATTASQLLNMGAKSKTANEWRNYYRVAQSEFRGPGGAKRLATASGWEVIGMKTYAKRFQGMGSSLLHGKGVVPASVALQSELFRVDRPGMYIDLHKEGFKGSAGASTLVTGVPDELRYVPIPSGKVLRQMAGEGLKEGLNWAPHRGDMLEGVMSLIERGNMPAGDAKTANLIAGDLANIFGFLGRAAGKGGYLTEHVFTKANIKGAGSARLVQQIGSEGLQAGTRGALSASDFTIGVTESYLKKVLGSDDAVKNVINEINQNKAYAWIQAAPQHAAHHGKLVKLKLEAELVGSKGAMEISLPSFMAWSLKRDNDKDTIFTWIFGKKHMDKMRKMGGAHSMEDILARQAMAETPGFSMFEKIMAQEREGLREFGSAQNVAKLTTKEAGQHLRALVSFGTLPTLPFTGFRATRGLLSTMADAERDMGGVLNTLNQKNISSLFKKETLEAADVTGWQDTWRRAIGAGLPEGSVLPKLADELAAFETAHHPIFQIAISKESSKAQAFISDFLGAQGEMLKMYQEGTHTEGAIRKAGYDRMLNFMQTAAGRTVDSAGNVSFQSADEVTPFLMDHAKKVGNAANAAQFDEYLRAQTHTLVSGYQAGISTRHAEMSFLNASEDLRHLAGAVGASEEALSGVLGMRTQLDQALTGQRSFEDITRMMLQDEIIEPMGTTRQKSAAAAAAADELVDGIGRSSSEVMEWALRNKKVLAGVAGGLAAVKVAGSLFANDEMPPPRFSSARSLQFPQAPMPPSMIPRVDEGDMQFTQGNFNRQRGFVQPANSQYSMTSLEGTSSSVNIDRVNRSMVASAGHFRSPHMNLNVSDSRSFKSNWEMQMMADRAGKSDFSSQYMGDLI